MYTDFQTKLALRPHTLLLWLYAGWSAGLGESKRRQGQREQDRQRKTALWCRQDDRHLEGKWALFWWIDQSTLLRSIICFPRRCVITFCSRIDYLCIALFFPRLQCAYCEHPVAESLKGSVLSNFCFSVFTHTSRLIWWRKVVIIAPQTGSFEMKGKGQPGTSQQMIWRRGRQFQPKC